MFLPALILQYQRIGLDQPTGFVQQSRPKGESPSNGMFLLERWVKLTEPDAGDGIKLVPSVENWSGWSGLTGGQKPDFPTPFAVDGAWNTIWNLAKLESGPSAAQWPVRVFIFRRSEGQSQAASGLVTNNRATIESRRINLILESLVRAKAVFQGASKSTLDVNYSVTQDQHPFIWNETPDGKNDIEANLKAYLDARFNGGSFTANDQLYRGPYRSVLVFWPMPTVPVETFTIHGTKVTVISTMMSNLSPGIFTTQVLSALNSSVLDAAQDQGYRVSGGGEITGGFSNPFLGLSATPNLIAKNFWVDGARYASNGKSPPLMKPNFILSLSSFAAQSHNVALSTVRDGKYSALSATWTGLRRRGGFALPLSSQAIADLKSGQYLNFLVKTKSQDPFHVLIGGRAELTDVVALGDGLEQGAAANVPSDGAWHQVSISFKEAFQKDPNAQAVVIGANSDLTKVPKISYLADTAEFADFSISASPSADAVEVRPRPMFPTERDALAVWTWKDATDPSFQTNFERALADHRDLVLLNALKALCHVDGSSVVASIINDFTSINPTIVDADAAALAHQNVPAARAYLVFATVHGINPRSRADAAMALAHSGIVGYGSRIGSLLAQKDWYARYAGVQALSTLNAQASDPDHLIDRYLEPFLSDFDPQVRLHAVLAMSGTDQKGLGKVLYVAVNDGSDAVRLAAYIKVFQYGETTLQSQAMSGFSDSSWWVRANLIESCAQLAVSTGFKSGLNQSQLDASINEELKDANPQVEAAAINALGITGATTVSSQQLASLQDILHPTVQLALIQAAIKCGWKLPDDIKNDLLGSQDFQIVQLAKKLP